MSRQLKFRGKRTDNGEWVVGDFIRHYENQRRFIACDQLAYTYSECGIDRLVTESFYEVAPETVGQFTDYKDTNEKPFIEGDIAYFTVFDHSGNDTQYYGIIKFFRGCWVVWVNEDLVFELGWVLEQDDEIEIIGNIHDNPELLEKESD